MNPTRKPQNAAAANMSSAHPSIMEGSQSYESFTFESLKDDPTGAYDETIHECDLCGLHLGGFNLLMHVHFFHNEVVSNICPCTDCNVYRLTEFLNEDRAYCDQRLEAKASPLLCQTSARAAAGTTKSIETGQDAPQEASIQQSSSQQTAIQLETVGNTTSKQTPARSNVSSTQHDSTLLRKLAPQVQPHRSNTSPNARPMPKQPQRLKNPPDSPTLIATDIFFFPGNGRFQETNLPYEMSLIESGKMHKDSSGRISWYAATELPPKLLNDEGNAVLSKSTGKAMKRLPLLPDAIPMSVQGWQLLCYFREAEKQGIHLRHQDIFDRMPGKLSHSGLTNRMQHWQLTVGVLASTRHMRFSWPSKQAMNSLRPLNGLQLRFNTWWDVTRGESSGDYTVTQPRLHALDRDRRVAPDVRMPSYMIRNPESRQMSSQVKLLDDALLFLEIKAAESNMSFDELMEWFWKPSEDRWIDELDLELICEFERWRFGCLYSPSVSCLSKALGEAGSLEERQALIAGDYSLTPWLQDVCDELAPIKVARREKDAEVRDVLVSRAGRRKKEKRQIQAVDDGENVVEGMKKRAVGGFRNGMQAKE